MQMRRLCALILCFTMLLTMSFNAEAYAHEDDVMRTENYQKTKAFVDSGDIYDLGLYSIEAAIHIIGSQNPDFADLCDDPLTITSLATLISQEDDEFLKDLMEYWHNYLLVQHGVSVRNATTGDHVPYTLTLPGGKTIIASRYTGTSIPAAYGDIADFPSTILLFPPSYHYNCHSYAWYLHGDITSHSPQLCFDDPAVFSEQGPCCATPVDSDDVQVGDIVTYDITLDFNYIEGHSAIVTSISAGTGMDQIVVASKWRYYGAYSHILSDCPYYVDRVMPNGDVYDTEIQFYRLSHKYILSGNYYYCRGCGYKNPVMVVSE